MDKVSPALAAHDICSVACVNILNKCNLVQPTGCYAEDYPWALVVQDSNRLTMVVT
jgi:hypothetical protein